MIGLTWHNYAAQKPAAIQIGNELMQEYDSIPVLPDASLIKSHDNRQPDHAMVGGIFSTKLEFEDIRKYYDKELTNKGWKFHKETKEVFNYKGNNYESRTLDYQKGDFMATILNPGKNDQKETFAFYVTWGLGPK